MWEEDWLCIDSGVGLVSGPQPAVYPNIASLDLLLLHRSIVTCLWKTEIIVWYALLLLKVKTLLLLLLVIEGVIVVAQLTAGSLRTVEVAIGWDQIWSKALLKKKLRQILRKYRKHLFFSRNLHVIFQSMKKDLAWFTTRHGSRNIKYKRACFSKKQAKNAFKCLLVVIHLRLNGLT